MTGTYVIEGNLGAGKSSVLSALREYGRQYHIVPEPVDLWTDFKGYNTLTLTYEDAHKHAMATSIFKAKTISDSQIFPYSLPVICERSLDSARNVFLKMKHDAGIMSEYEMIVYDEIVKSLPRREPDIYFYLRASPETCATRVNLRDRQGEEAVSIEFLANMDKYYNEFMTNTAKRIPVIEINTETTPLEEAAEIIDAIISENEFFINGGE